MKRKFILYNNSSETFDVKEPESHEILWITKCAITAERKHGQFGGALYVYEYENDGTLLEMRLIITTKMKPSRPKRRREGPRRMR